MNGALQQKAIPCHRRKRGEIQGVVLILFINYQEEYGYAVLVVLPGLACLSIYRVALLGGKAKKIKQIKKVQFFFSALDAGQLLPVNCHCIFIFAFERTAHVSDGSKKRAHRRITENTLKVTVSK